MNKITNFYEHKPAGGAKAKQIILLLHGFGSNGQDLISLAPLWARDLPDAVFISPDAPYPCAMGGGGYQWFALHDRNPQRMLSEAKALMPVLTDFIGAQLEKYALLADKLALVGFSQGTMVSLYAGPHYPDKIAGILGYSGALLWEEGAKDMHKIPVHIIHGDADDVVPVLAYHHAHKTLSESGFTVTGSITRGLAHSIDPGGLKDGADFLKSILC